MTIFYPDIASYQAGISLKGAKAVCCKVTESTNYVNPDYARARANAAANGTFFFAYHFLHHGNAAAQARWAFAHAGKTPLMLDVEPTPATRANIADIINFVVAYRALGGVVHVVYLPQWYWKELGKPSLAAAKQAGMVLVSSSYTPYTDQSGVKGWAPYGGFTPTVWQFSDGTAFNGFRVDFNAFRGSLAQFKSIVTTGHNPPIQILVTVPVTYGMRAADAIAAIEKAGLTVTTSPLRDPGNEYASLGSSPIGGSRVKKGSDVTLHVRVIKKG